ncbi:hypothetical protein Q5762_31360 [Streptomyces sp. P9(2023)]|nr:hypothetical protein [Streptomyces sp. P9(2023)]
MNRIVYSSGISSPVTSNRGLAARLRYLDSEAGLEALKTQGVTDRALKSWTEGGVTPSPKSRERIDSAYWERRRANLIRSGWLKRHLDNDGQGSRMEIYPVDQSQVDEKRRRPTLSQRSITVRYIWEDLVGAYADQDDDMMDEIWDDVISDLDSDFAAYAYVASVGIGA